MNLFDLRERLGQAGAQITFCGSFTHSLIVELGVAVRRYLEGSAVKKSAVMGVFSVFVEAAQNVRNYTAARLAAGWEPDLAQSSILVIARCGDHYEVHAGNVVEPEDAAALVARLDHLVSLDRAGLQVAYREQLRTRQPSDATHAGLGLLEMARLAAQPLGYELTPMSDHRSYFSLRVVI